MARPRRTPSDPDDSAIPGAGQPTDGAAATDPRARETRGAPGGLGSDATGGPFTGVPDASAGARQDGASPQPTWQDGALPSALGSQAPYAAPAPEEPQQGQAPSALDLSGVSSWVGHYLQTEHDSAAVSPVDSNANAGVSDVDGGEGQIQGEGAPERASGHLASLRGPLPVVLFSLIAVGGIGLILGRSARALTGRRGESAE
ncbi:hypothetical protein NBM05_09620 [Rothia sp. AR01]|uniref:Uncharacterized protein n=1 Tax=Rothia santali TaxID=2949643 RepID=A0A9X2HAV3_9MICC|nr:hypothetical protein [Rothia santali]MCP3426254.1 hypothetical protein [Rothia santali]